MAPKFLVIGTIGIALPQISHWSLQYLQGGKRDKVLVVKLIDGTELIIDERTAGISAEKAVDILRDWIRGGVL